jgi:FkbM family methyltransferase
MFGLNNLDEKVIQIINDNGIKNQFFIEAGANDGLSQSNTAVLELQKNWKGICIEPNYENYKRCIVNRKNSIVVNAALVGNDYSEKTIRGTFNDNSTSRANGLMSSCDSEALKEFPEFICEVPARTLTSILDEYANGVSIGFFSLDVECYELEALSGLDFSRYRPEMIMMEIGRWYVDGVVDAHFEFMKNNDYKFLVCPTKNDFIFLDEKR